VIERLAIIGVGLLGGSVAKAVRAGGLAREVIGIGRDRARLQPAVRDGVLDRATTDFRDGLAGADLVLLAAPVLQNEALLERVWPLAEDGAIVTDVGSTKTGIVRAADRLRAGRALAFVGSHPMAGSEQSGYAFARHDLFEHACVIVTPTDVGGPDTPRSCVAASHAHALKIVTGLWEALGARVAVLDPEVHDRVVAAISHLPHLVADALVDAVVRFEPGATAFAAGGFRDTTRIAASDPAMWQEIFVANRQALLASVGAFRMALDALEARVRAGDRAALEADLARIKRAREAVA
jgi:prephenate dehydrogenase